MSKTLDTVKDMIVEKLGIKREILDENKPMKEFGLDSLSQVELLFVLEDHFNVRIPDAQAKVTNLKELAEAIDRLKSENKAG